MELHSKETADLHEKLHQAYKDRLEELEDDDSSFESTFLHNAIYLHNLWFEQLKKTSDQTDSPILEEILSRRDSDMSTFIKWMNGFAEEAKPHGWAVWGYSMSLKTFVGFPLKGHDQFIPLGVVPILVIDCWEHSYVVDFGNEFERYLDKFWKDLNFDILESRHAELAHLFGFNLK